MTLHDLTEQLAPSFPPSVQKDLKTAVKVLAQAMGYTEPMACPLERCLHPLPELYRTIETFLLSQGKSPHTIRNAKNNLSRLFRLAAAEGLFSLLPAKLTKRFSFTHFPHRWPHTRYTTPDGSYLRHRHWPRALKADFAAFTKWATDPFVEGRDAAWRKRPITILGYEHVLEAYFGYLSHELYIGPVEFNHLFDRTLLESFVQWHINTKWHRPTRLLIQFLQSVHAMACQYRPDPELADWLDALRKRLPRPPRVYNKSDAWVPLREIERVGLALWPHKSPESLRTPGTHPEGIGRKYAARATASLMLRLWVHIPYRQRNMREMKMQQNLYRTPEGQWRIRFADEDLKVATRRGRSNVFDLPFPPALVETLESYLTIWRPILARIENRPEVFLTRDGGVFKVHSIRSTLQRHIYSFTGRRWHPHMMRTIWATEWIQSSGDFMTAAIMLNDHLKTVIQNYAHLRDENVAENAYQWVQARINHH
jgi:hypothetical protein